MINHCFVVPLFSLKFCFILPKCAIASRIAVSHGLSPSSLHIEILAEIFSSHLSAVYLLAFWLRCSYNCSWNLTNECDRMNSNQPYRDIWFWIGDDGHWEVSKVFFKRDDSIDDEMEGLSMCITFWSTGLFLVVFFIYWHLSICSLIHSLFKGTYRCFSSDSSLSHAWLTVLSPWTRHREGTVYLSAVDL